MKSIKDYNGLFTYVFFRDNWIYPVMSFKKENDLQINV